MENENCRYCGVSHDTRGLKSHESNCKFKHTGGDIPDTTGVKSIDTSKYLETSPDTVCDIPESDNTLLQVGAVVSIAAGFLALGAFLKKAVRGA